MDTEKTDFDPSRIEMKLAAMERAIAEVRDILRGAPPRTRKKRLSSNAEAMRGCYSEVVTAIPSPILEWLLNSNRRSIANGIKRLKEEKFIDCYQPRLRGIGWYVRAGLNFPAMEPDVRLVHMVRSVLALRFNRAMPVVNGRQVGFDAGLEAMTGEQIAPALLSLVREGFINLSPEGVVTPARAEPAKE